MEVFTKFNTGDGLPHFMFKANASDKGPEGELYFGSIAGMVVFHPDSIQINSTIPPVMITGFKVENREIIPGANSVLKRSILYTDSVSLSYQQNSLTISFSVMNYVQSWRNQYRYKLEGLEKEWVYSGIRNDVTYAGLRPGKYLFKVAGTNNNGVWNEEGDSLTITIRPPPWLTWWAYIIYSLLFVSILLWYRSYLIKRAKLTTALELEHMEKEKLEELDKIKSQFFANISHEFRTPLTLLLGPLENKLKSTENLDRNDRRLFETMHRNSRRLQRLINQLLDLSRLESGKTRLKVSEGDISAFARSIAQSFLSLAESKNIKYRIGIPPSSIQAYFDPDIIEKILSNLLANAFKFTQENGSVSIRLKAGQNKLNIEHDYVEFIVSDTGKGIPADLSEKIFDRFYQVSSSDSRDFEGTGIGLALCKELAEIHYGQISVKSAPGKGSEFTVILPCSQNQFSANEITEEKIGIMKADFALRDPEILEFTESEKDYKSILDKDSPILLIIEDNADLRQYIIENLRADYEIHEAVNGIDGIRKTNEIIPDIVITDIMMPEMDGIEYCNNMKNNENTCHIPVIMLTARADRDSRIRGLKTGADDYLVKPFDAEELRIKVKNNIEQQNKLREKFYRDLIFGDHGDQVINADDRFLEKTIDHINVHLSDNEFSVDYLSRIMGVSQMQLYRKIKGSTNMSPNELIRNLRLKSSQVLLKKGFDNISQIAYQVGFSDHSYFTKCFRELFGMTPKAYSEAR